VGSPNFLSARETAGDVISVAFDRPIAVACGTSADHLRQVAFETGRGTFNPAAMSGGPQVRVQFASATVQMDASSDGALLYGDASNGSADCGDLVDFSGNPVRNLGPVATVES